jgi:nucleotide-binding universal stress UspA family protein
MESLDKLVPPDLRARTACYTRVGSAEEAIEAFVRQTEPALVVMGTHVRQFWRRHFTRNVARQFLHGATCPVWFVPPTVPH